MKLTKEAMYLGVIIVLIAVCGQFYYTFKYKPAKSRDVRVYYNRDVTANEELINVIRDADKFVYFAIYTFTRDDVKDALLAAKYRGLDIQGLTDNDQVKGLEIQRKIIKELRDAGIPVAEQSHSAIMHIKTVVTDKQYFTGSYNWTAAATKSNDEVIEIGRDEDIRKQYQNIIEQVIKKYQK